MTPKKVSNKKPRILHYLGMNLSINRLKLIRGYSYISTFAIPFLVARELSKMIPQFSWWILFLFSMVAVWVIGHVDFNRLWKNELELSFTKNPEWIRTMDRLIDKLLEKELKRHKKSNGKLRKRVSSK